MTKLRFQLTSWLFTRLLGLIYLFAFQSVACQIVGLVGERGILPAGILLDSLSSQVGIERFWLFPTVFWLNYSDLFLQGACWFGCLLALLVVAGLFVGPSLLCLWILYLSVITVGQDFLSFQWDILLVETGFLAIFLSPWCVLEPWVGGNVQNFAPSRLILWLLRILVFKLMLQSGLVKLLSGDPTWLSLSALDYHYYTQPLPTPAAYFAAHLPQTFNHFSCMIMFGIELCIPFAILLGRWGRIFAASVFIVFQLLIMVTGNYAFFNLLTIGLSLTLLDDRIFMRILPGSLSLPFRLARKPKQSGFSLTSLPRTASIYAATALIVLLTAGHLVGYHSLPPSALSFMRNLTSFYFVNSYGLFAVMTTERDEIIVEGSNDGEHWLNYEFIFKPGDLNRAPPIVAPYQPRLDWQMWFAALADYENSPWFTNFVLRLLQGSPDVLHLLKTNPFPQSPPKYIRAELYKYTFTEPGELSKNGTWWKSEFLRYYLPPIGMRGRQEE
jgi:lipase maturation factor 1